MKHLPIIIIALALLSSCSNNDEAIEVSRNFFTSLSDTTNGKPTAFYPYYDSLDIEARSDVVDISNSDVTEKNDTFTVRCYNNYTTSDGTFKQDSVTLYLARNKEMQLVIYDSQGLVVLDDDTEWFGRATGALGKVKLKDKALSKTASQIGAMMFDEYLTTKQMLSEKVKIVNWSWETSYSGEAHGEGRVVNKSDYALKGIKYHVNYYDRADNFMAEDDGTINKTLYPGEKYDFTFWSSNAKYPNTANLRLEFSDRMVIEVIKDKNFKGTEFKEYLKSRK